LIADKILKELKLSHEGIMVLGIQREKGNYIGTPGGHTKILPKDVLTIYGRASLFESLDNRKKGVAGDKEHEAATAEHSHVEKSEKGEDKINR
jgi:uncharacterized protein with PhoU and TrkA domain